MNPLVSIIVPAYNRASLIVETLESIRMQDYSPIETLIVDDGSSDGTPETAAMWIQQHDVRGFSLHILPQNSGKSQAVNTGFDKMQGQYVMILDSDDCLLPDAITKAVGYFEAHPEPGAVFGKAYILDNGKRTQQLLGCFADEGEFDDLDEKYGDLILKGNALISSTVMMKSEVIRSIGGLRTDFHYVHDWEYWARIARQYPIGFLGIPVLHYRVSSPGAQSANRTGTFHETCQLLIEHSHIYSRRALLRALGGQTKYNLSLCYHDGNIPGSVKILIKAGQAAVRLLVQQHQRT